jgi:hypothetical protein
MDAEPAAIRVPGTLRLAVILVVTVATGAGLTVGIFRYREANLPSAVPDRPAPITPAPVAAAPAATPLAEPSCGQDNQADCPLQHWMDQRMNTAFTTRNVRDLVSAFRFLSKIAPARYQDWVGWAAGGAAAAARSDFQVVKRACTGCHNDYRERYRLELRGRALPAE